MGRYITPTFWVLFPTGNMIFSFEVDFQQFWRISFPFCRTSSFSSDALWDWHFEYIIQHLHLNSLSYSERALAGMMYSGTLLYNFSGGWSLDHCHDTVQDLVRWSNSAQKSGCSSSIVAPKIKMCLASFVDVHATQFLDDVHSQKEVESQWLAVYH